MSIGRPQCDEAHEQKLECARLEPLAGEMPVAPAYRLGDGSESSWQKTVWGKVAAGLLLAQGLSYGAHNLLLACFPVASPDDTSPDALWNTFLRLVLLQVLQAVSLLAGGALSGSGQRYGGWCGAAIGLVNAIITLVWQHNEPYAPFLIYALPVLHLMLGTLGGLAGSLIWQPTPDLPVFGPAQRSAPLASAGSLSAGLMDGPLHLMRVCLGTLIVVLGVAFSSAILDYILRISQLTFSSQLQARIVGWEVGALAVLCGSAFAGASSFNGFKHGLVVGLSASVFVLAIDLGNPKLTPETIAISLAGIIVVSAAGGWFGSHLLPPVHQGKRRRTSPV